MKNKTIDIKNGSILVVLNHGKNALISKEDSWVLDHKWRATRMKDRWYVARGENYKILYLHRVLTNSPKGSHVDHIDGNGLNNTRANIRVCSHSQNCANRQVNKNSKTGFRGVTCHRKSYRADIEVNGKKIYIGTYSTAPFAAIAYNSAAIKYFGDYAYLNDV